MSTLIPPVDAYAARSCNWYCHRLSSGGRQHELAEQAIGPGGAATASLMEQAARASITRGIDEPGFMLILHLHLGRTRHRVIGLAPRVSVATTPCSYFGSSSVDVATP